MKFRSQSMVIVPRRNAFVSEDFSFRVGNRIRRRGDMFVSWFVIRVDYGHTCVGRHQIQYLACREIGRIQRYRLRVRDPVPIQIQVQHHGGQGFIGPCWFVLAENATIFEGDTCYLSGAIAKVKTGN